MNTIRELKAKEKYDNMLKRKNKEKNIYKSKNSTLRIEKMNLIKAVERKDKEIERLNKELEEFKEEHKIMKQILIENNLWEKLLNDDRFLEHLRK